MKQDTAPYYYVAKLESHLEARLWNDVFVLAQNLLGVPVGTIRSEKKYVVLYDRLAEDPRNVTRK